jgi:hypothetical protein
VIRRRQPIARSSVPLKRTPLARRSAQRRSEDRERKQVREQVYARDGGCIMRAYGGCAGPIDVDEIVSRGRGGSYLDVDNCQALCRRHHDAKHSRVHYASIIGLWGEHAMRLHVHAELGGEGTLEDEFDLHERALRAFLEG